MKAWCSTSAPCCSSGTRWRCCSAVPELAPDEAGARRVAAQVFESFTPDSDWARFDLGLVAEDELAQRIATRMGAQAQQVRRIIDAIPPHLQPQGTQRGAVQRG
jgi:hypothetical protein